MAQLQQRITYPFMPQGSPDLTNAPTPLYAPGELGCAFNDQNGRAYQRVLLDSGATSATPVGAVAAGQTAYWKDRLNNIVTNDKRFCDAVVSSASLGASVNRVAGIFRTAVSATPGVNNVQGQPVQYACDILIQGVGIPVVSDGTGAAGSVAISDATAATARVTTVAAGTAPTSTVIGIVRAPAAAGFISVDVSIGFIE